MKKKKKNEQEEKLHEEGIQKSEWGEKKRLQL